MTHRRLEPSGLCVRLAFDFDSSGSGDVSSSDRRMNGGLTVQRLVPLGPSETVENILHECFLEGRDARHMVSQRIRSQKLV